MKKPFTVFLIAAFLFWIRPLFAFEEKLDRVLESRYFTVYAYSGFNVNSLIPKLNFQYLLHLDRVDGEAAATPSDILSKTLDALYLEVSDILDIHIYSFRGSIRIFAQQDSLNAALKEFFGVDFKGPSFYLQEQNTIFISDADLTLGVLGHEMAHAIISGFFVVPPPAKIQEVLAGYVEYNLRKSTDTLP
jgi:hypothetical protein